MSTPARFEVDDAVSTWMKSLQKTFGGERAPIPDPPCSDCRRPIALSDAQRYRDDDVPSRCTECRDDRQRKRRIAEVSFTIPRDFKDASLRWPHLPRRLVRPLAAVDELLAAPRIVFVGAGSGLGKTSLAVALLREAAARGRVGRFASAYSLAKARALHGLGKGEAPAIAEALSAEILVIDDFGNEQRSELSPIKEIVHERHAARRTTWITTGLAMEQISSWYGDNIARRIFEGAEVIEFRNAKDAQPAHVTSGHA